MEITNWTIGQLAEHAGVRTSALRYYDEIGLLTPASRHHGQRRYTAAQVYRLSAIQLLHNVGKLPLVDVQAVLDRGKDTVTWRQAVRCHSQQLRQQITSLHVAVGLLDHAAACEHEGTFETCPELATLLSLP